MLSVTPITHAKQSSQYFSKEDGYYLSEENAKTHSSWFGKGAQMLGLKGNVDEKTLFHMLEGRLKSGEVIGLNPSLKNQRRPGFQFCLSAPKSVSILALEAGDKRFLQAHQSAVEKTVSLIERDCAQARTFSEKGTAFENTKNLAVALIPHRISRALDCQLHTHCLVMNLTQRKDGQWRALASTMKQEGDVINGFRERLYRNAIYYGMVYRAELAKSVKSFGFEVERVGPHGLWEIKEVPKAARDVLSKRSTEIKAAMQAVDYQSLKSKDIATLGSRSVKDNSINYEKLREVWKSELNGVDFSSKELITRVAKEKEAQPSQYPSASPSVTAQKAVRDAIEHLSQFSVQISYEKLVSQALQFSLGRHDHPDIIKSIDCAVQEKALIPLNENSSRFTTSELIGVEKQLMDFIEKGKGKAAELRLKSSSLEQIKAGGSESALALDVLHSKDRHNIIDVISRDKQALLTTLLHVAEQGGKTVRILTPNRLMANETNKTIQRQTNTLRGWLAALGKTEVGETLQGFQFRYEKALEQPLARLRQGKEVLIVDQAERLGNHDMKRLLDLSERGKAKVIFINNAKATKGFLSGNPMTVLKQSSVPSFRCQNTAMRDRTLHTIFIEKENDETRMERLAQHYAALSPEEKQKTVIIAGTKSQKNALNSVVREALKNQGDLGRCETEVNTLEPLFLTKPQQRLASQYKKGWVVRFYEGQGVVKDWHVAKTCRHRNVVVLADAKNRHRHWNPAQEPHDCRLFKEDTLALSSGDKLRATANMRVLGIKQGSELTVVDVNQKTLRVTQGKKTQTLSLKKLNGAHLAYQYVESLSNIALKQHAHVIAFSKAYALNQNTMNTLSDAAKQSLTIFTDNKALAESRLTKIPKKHTAMERVLQTQNPIDRLTDKKTHHEIKRDIENAITVLTTKATPTAAGKAVDFALKKIASQQAGFKHRDLVKEALNHGLGENVAHTDIMAVLQEKRESGELIMGRYFSDGTRWTTKAALEAEHEILSEVKKGKNSVNPLVDAKQASIVLAETQLTQGQKSAAHLITTTRDQFVLVQGYAGTGKTTLLKQVHSMLPENYRLMGFAPTHKAVLELKEKSIQAQTLKSFIVEKQNHKDFSNTLLALDEASMVSNKDFLDFVKIVRSTKARCAIVGDIAQHLSIESGKPFELLQRSQLLSVATLKEIIRQKDPNLKSAVENVIAKEIVSAFKKVDAINPQKQIIRTNESDFFKTLKNSIVSRDNAGKEKGIPTLEQQLVDDYVSRADEVRKNTVVIVHANEDREKINGMIREGLKTQGEVAQQETTITRLVSKNLTHVEHERLDAYKKDDVVKIGNTYYRVEKKDPTTQSLLLRDNAGKERYFHPEKIDENMPVEIYDVKSSELAVGDSVRLRKTDKTRGHFANKEYRVTAIEDNHLTLKNDREKTLTLNSQELRDAHWDYAYTITGYGVQGSNKPYVIDYELSYRKNLTNQRSFYIAISRAQQHVTIYTDDKVKLLNRLQNNTEQKYSAHDIIREVDWSDPSGTASKEEIGLPNEKTERAMIQESRKIKTVTDFLSKEDIRRVEASIHLEEKSGALTIEKEVVIANVNRELADTEREIY